MDLEGVMLREITDRDKYCISYVDSKKSIKQQQTPSKLIEKEITGDIGGGEFKRYKPPVINKY